MSKYSSQQTEAENIEPGRVLWLDRYDLEVTPDLRVDTDLSTGGMGL